MENVISNKWNKKANSSAVLMSDKNRQKIFFCENQSLEKKKVIPY